MLRKVVNVQQEQQRSNYVILLLHLKIENLCKKKLQKTIFSKVSLVTPLKNGNQEWKPIMTFKTGSMMTI